ncbi:STAS-like domain-containing protein [Olivibacter sp. SDN3]|uniref:STAS-like domain-containing protein n=1 Tax=Olivibacter sp. SDN3 TaxID=2764720 RepID=UPI001651587E|nr:STAS-like domain-containing protein [Olivibacter sp. SDN3]QNL51959.1 STAS-like domain-containing protein [Olivibacter sp. SDN3]
MELKVVDVIKSDVALSPEPAHLLYQEIRNIVRNKNVAIIDFSKVQILSTAFLNSAIGRLYSDFSSEELNEYLKIVNLADDDKNLLRKVIKRAKEYFADKDSFDKKIGDRYDQ